MITDLEEIERLSKEGLGKNYAFIQALNQYLHGTETRRLKDFCIRINELSVKYTKLIDCTMCGNCCIGQAGNIKTSTEDHTLLAKELNVSTEKLKTQYLEMLDGEYYLSTPCPLLAGKECSAYAGRPEICRRFPYLDKDFLLSALHRFPLQQLVSRASFCPIVFNVLEDLKKSYRSSE